MTARYVQGSNSNNRSSGVLGVESQESFAQLIGISQVDRKYLVEAFYRINLNNAVGDIEKYDKIVVQIKKQYTKQQGISLGLASDPIDENYPQKIKTNTSSRSESSSLESLKKYKLIALPEGSSIPNYPKKVADKLYSGIVSVVDLKKNAIKENETIIGEETVYLTNYLKEALNSVYSYVDLSAPEKIAIDVSKKQIIGDQLLDPTDIISFVNKNSFTLSQYNEKDRNSWNSPQRMIFDFISNIKDKPGLDTLTYYKPVRKTGKLKQVTIPVLMHIPIRFRGLNFEIVCSLYKKDSTSPDETITNVLNFSNLIEEYYLLTDTNSSLNVTVTSESKLKNKYRLNVSFTGSPDERRKISGYNVYQKTVEKSKKVHDFELIDSILVQDQTTTSSSTHIKCTHPLHIIRVVPVYSNSKESHLFKDVSIGPGYSSMGTITISAYNSIQQTIISVFNVPKEARYVELYKRNPNDHGSEFKIVNAIPTNGSSRNVTIHDSTPEVGTFEYFVAVFVPDELSSGREKILVSNYIAHEYFQFDKSKKISVHLSENDVNIVKNETDPTISFMIETSVVSSEAKKTVESLWTASPLTEIYNKYINPETLDDPAQTGNDSAVGVPEYDDIYFHEVVRVNVDTGEREIFELVPDGTFEDNNASRSKKGIKPLDLQYSYIYQIFTYSRNPIELFKNYVAHGTRIGSSSNKREWFYLPYKWLNPKTKRGLLYPSNNEGVPLIPESENIKGKTYGLTKTYKVSGITDKVSVKDVTATRITRKTVEITWDIDSTSLMNAYKVSPYDSFMVIAVVNGKQKYIGSTKEKFMYHRLTYNETNLDNNDYGTIYYVVIPVLKRLSIDSPEYSNEIIVNPLGFHDALKVPNAVLEFKNQTSTGGR